MKVLRGSDFAIFLLWETEEFYSLCFGERRKFPCSGFFMKKIAYGFSGFGAQTFQAMTHGSLQKPHPPY